MSTSLQTTLTPAAHPTKPLTRRAESNTENSLIYRTGARRPTVFKSGLNLDDDNYEDDNRNNNITICG
jgi:hypothetical protein